jgi:hypothetical protein
MKPYLTGLIVAAVPALVALACNNSTTFDDANQAPGSAESLAEDELPAFIAEAQCDQQLSCDCYLEAGPVGEDPAAWTRNQCIENRKLELSHWQGRQHAEGLSYDGACALRKLAVAQSWACGDLLDAQEIGLAERDCGTRCRVYHGDKQVGETCDSEIDDCAQGLACRYDSASIGLDGQALNRCMNVCGGEGARCLNDECAPGLYCRYDYQGSDGSRCARMPQEGDTCSEYDYACAASLCTAGVCVGYAEDGAACDATTLPCGGNCVDNVCEPGPAHICSWDLRWP